MSLVKEAVRASFWSSLTEVVLKLISPLVFLILTRILLPEDFGIVAIATNLLSFIYIIADLGLSKVIIQFKGDNYECNKVYNVAFYTNLCIGLILFCFVFFGSDYIANLYNQHEASDVIKLMSLQIIFFSFSSVQNAIKRKQLEFKFLFYTRLVTVVIPACISIPFAFSGYGYWAIVYGSTSGALLASIVTWIFTDWKPSFFWCNKVFIKLLGKSVWSSLEQLLVWLPMFLDTFLISNYLSKTELGFFTTSKTLFTTVMGVSLAAIIPVLYSTLSKISVNDKVSYLNTLMIVQKLIFIIAAFCGVGVFMFRNEVESIFFTEKWHGINIIIGLMFLIMSFEYFFSVLTEGLRARGYFREISINTFIAIFLTTITLIFSIRYGLITYVIVRSLSLYYYLPGLLYLSKKKLGLKTVELIKNNFFVFALSFSLIVIILGLEYCIESIVNIFVIKVVIYLLFVSMILFRERLLIKFLKNKIKR
ncbi:oligosaccharide flippase family protein [Myroides odoratimimus]|uniref:oligosaccharide flippase family protein n=1 Tax=Myroides odoratimimus TaxID=76832 RepID=UPI002578B5FC|nr:oligosaccharide flippase family protein [Myroides odoratimimus]MDM1447994.1 oligosaccharide flippase family protein [Myroides odoratimimus]